VNGKWQLLILCVCVLCSPPASADRSSPGCGTAATGTDGFKTLTVRVGDRDRTYHLWIPKTYDPKRAYPLIFRWHGRGGDGLSGGLDIEAVAGGDAIIVGADGWRRSWGSDDLVFFDRMLEEIEATYCVDRSRVFSYGFSVGGFLTNLLACERGDVLRGSASIAGGPWGNDCHGNVASWFLHDEEDRRIPIALGEAARDRAIKTNRCSTTTVDEDDGCVRYRGCEKAPVVWCETHGFGHDIRGDFAPSRVWKFFQSLR